MHVPFTAALIKSLRFDQRPVSWSEEHGLVTEPTPPNVRDWVLRDSLTPGFGIRVWRGKSSFFVQRKRGGSTSDRWKIGRAHV